MDLSEEEQHEEEEIFNEIVNGRRTRWHLQSTVLTQWDVAISASIQS
jgi:hypothetical protein